MVYTIQCNRKDQRIRIEFRWILRNKILIRSFRALLALLALSAKGD
jgi:hypothetical protein